MQSHLRVRLFVLGWLSSDHVRGEQVRKGWLRRAWFVGWPLALLCLLVASRWFIEGAVPATASSDASLGIGCTLCGAALQLWSLTGPGRVRLHPRDFPWTAALGTLLITAGPALASLVAGRNLNANDATLALALCPVMVALCISTTSEEGDGGLAARMWPGLAGVAGLLLLLPEPQYNTWRPWAGLMCLPLLLGVGACLWFRKIERSADASILATGTGLLGGGALLLGLFWLRRSSAGPALSTNLEAGGLDGAIAVLTILALARGGAVRWSAQFLLIPFLSLAESLLLLRPFLDGRSVLGMVLIALSGVYQVFMAPVAGSSALPLRLRIGPDTVVETDDVR